MKMKPGFEHAERVAFATSEPADDGRAARWTELAVYYDHGDIGRPWIAVARGCSTYPNERLREEVVKVGTLGRALKLFDENSSLTRSVVVQAEQWAEEVEARRAVAPAQFDGHSQDEALMWLFGDLLNTAKAPSLIAKIFGVGESSARMQLNGGRDVKISLKDAARFIDRDKVRAALAVTRG